MNDESLLKAVTPDGKQKVVALRGIPGSGKTTFALEALRAFPGTVARINNDDLSTAIFGKPWVSELGDSSQMFLEFRKSILSNLLLNEQIEVIILDNTNLYVPAVKSLENISRSMGADFIVSDYFLSVPLEECISRDAQRSRAVGESVIRKMHAKVISLAPYAYSK
jgi:predicted kinase